MLTSVKRDRRAAVRYRVPGHARVFWCDARAAAVSVEDVSAHGCRVLGTRVPEVGTRVFLSLDVADLPNVRLPATAVRRYDHRLGRCAAVRFDVPTASTQGLDLLLARQVGPCVRKPVMLVVDRNGRSRSRIADAARASGCEVVVVDTASQALTAVRRERIDLVVARCDAAGIAALAAVQNASPTTLRAGFGRHEQVTQAMTLGHAQALADDPCSAKCLRALVDGQLAYEEGGAHGTGRTTV